MNTLPFELLEVLVAMAETKNLVDAARRLGLSQPAVSLKLKALEQRAGLPVFGVEGRRKILTHYGRSLYQMGRSQLDSMNQELEKVNRKYHDPTQLTLRVGCRPEVFDALAMVFKFAGTIEFKSCSSHQAVQALLSHEIDLAISYERPDSTDIYSKKILQSDAIFVVHKRHIKSKRVSVASLQRPEFIKNLPWVIYQDSGHLLRDLLAKIKLPLQDLKIRCISEDWRLMQKLVDQGWGAAILPSYVESGSDELIKIVIPQALSPRFDFYALFHKELRQIPAFRRFLDQLIP